MSKRNSAEALSIDHEDSEGLTEEELQAGIIRLARIRKNICSIQTELSKKILDAVRDCRESTDAAMATIGEINAIAIKQK